MTDSTMDLSWVSTDRPDILSDTRGWEGGWQVNEGGCILPNTVLLCKLSLLILFVFCSHPYRPLLAVYFYTSMYFSHLQLRGKTWLWHGTLWRIGGCITCFGVILGWSHTEWYHHVSVLRAMTQRRSVTFLTQYPQYTVCFPFKSDFLFCLCPA